MEINRITINYLDKFQVILISSFIALNLDKIITLTYVNIFVILLCIIEIFRTINNLKIDKESIRKQNMFKVNSQNDNLDRCFFYLITLSAVLYLGYQFNYELNISQKILYSILLLTILIIGYANRHHTYFKVIDDFQIKYEKKDFSVKSNDKKIELSKFAIIKIGYNGEIEELNEIILNKDKALRFKIWIVTKLNNPEIDFYWKEGDNIVPL